MTRKDRRRGDSSSENDDDDDEEDDEEEDGDDDDDSGDSGNEIHKSNKRKKKKKKQSQDQPVRKDVKKKPTLRYPNGPAPGVRAVKKKVTIIEGGKLDERTDERSDDFNMPKRILKRSNTIARSHLEDVQSDENDDSAQQHRTPYQKRRSQCKTLIATSNLQKLQTKATMVDQQSLMIHDLSRKLEQKDKQAQQCLSEEQRQNGLKMKEIEIISSEKTHLERKIGRQATYLKRLKNQLKVNRGSAFSIGLERRNSLGKTEVIKVQEDEESAELEATTGSSSIYYLRVLNWLQYHYPLSRFVHRITNFYTKNEELHFTLLAVYANLALLAFLSALPFVMKQLSSSLAQYSTQKPLSKLMMHEYDPDLLDLALVNIFTFTLMNAVIVYYKISYVRQKQVEMEAHSQKDRTYFKLVFASINFRLKTREFTQKQQMSLYERVQLSQKLSAAYEKKRASAGRLIYLIRLFLYSIQLFQLFACMWLMQYASKQWNLTTPMLLNLPLQYGVVTVLLSSFASQLPIYLTQFELYRTHLKSNKVRVWKGFLFNCLMIFYTVLLASPIQNLDFLGISSTFQLINSEYNCASEQAIYVMLSIYLTQLFYGIIELIVPSLLNRLFARIKQRSQSFKRSLAPFKVMESTYPICILNMLSNMIFPQFPFMGLLHSISLLFLFAINWQVVLRLKYQHFSSVSRSFLMNTLLNFYVISFALPVAYYCIMAYQNQSSYFVGTQYTSMQRVCGPLSIGETIADRISKQLTSIQYVSDAYRLLSWNPLLWMAIIYFFSVSRLELSTKRVWRQEFFKKIKEQEVIKNFYLAKIKSYEDKIKKATNELTNFNTDTPRAAALTQTITHDSSRDNNNNNNSHGILQTKSKFASPQQASPTLTAQTHTSYSPLLNNSGGIGNFSSYFEPAHSANFPTMSDEVKSKESAQRKQSPMFSLNYRSKNAQ